MRLAALLDLTGGRLVNQPSVAFFERIVLDPEKVRRGDLFLLRNGPEEAHEAVKNGAYGVLSDLPDLEPSDPEAAWIRVPDLEEALVRLLRYTLLERKNPLFRCSRTDGLVAASLLRWEVTVLSSRSLFDQAARYFLEEESLPVLCADPALWESVAPEASPLPEGKTLSLLSHTLFTMKLLVRDESREVAWPPLFLPSLERVVGFAQERGLAWRIPARNATGRFRPLFVNGKLEEVPFGKGDRVVLLDPLADEEERREAVEYLERNGSWGRVAVIPVEEAGTLEAAVERLKGERFRFAYLPGFPEEAAWPMASTGPEASLFT